MAAVFTVTLVLLSKILACNINRKRRQFKMKSLEMENTRRVMMTIMTNIFHTDVHAGGSQT